MSEEMVVQQSNLEDLLIIACFVKRDFETLTINSKSCFYHFSQKENLISFARKESKKIRVFHEFSLFLWLKRNMEISKSP